MKNNLYRQFIKNMLNYKKKYMEINKWNKTNFQEQNY